MKFEGATQDLESKKENPNKKSTIEKIEEDDEKVKKNILKFEHEIQDEKEAQREKIEKEAIIKQQQKTPLPNFFDIINRQDNSVAKRKFVIGSVAMLCFPLFMFFLSYYFLLVKIIPIDNSSTRLAWSGGVAMVGVQVVIGAFIVSALNEEQ